MNRNLNGWKKELPDHRDYMLIPRTSVLPVWASVRHMCPRVEDQSSYSSCTAQAGTSMVEFLYKHSKVRQPELSRLFLYYATRVWVEGQPPTSDDGAYIRDVMTALVKYGTCLESVWPYSKPLSKEPGVTAKRDALTRQILEYRRCPGLLSIKQCIVDGYPVEGGFSVPESIYGEYTDTTGVVRYPTRTESIIGGHAVLFVGYDDSTQTLCFQNSWGENWGDGGYGYLPYSFVTNGLADDFWTIRCTEGFGNNILSIEPLSRWERFKLWIASWWS